MSEDTTEKKSDLTDVLRENAAGPKKVVGDAGSVEQHSLSDLIVADRYVKSTETVQSPGLGIKLVKMSPDGTV